MNSVILNLKVFQSTFSKRCWIIFMVEEAIIVVAIGSFEIIFSCDRELLSSSCDILLVLLILSFVLCCVLQMKSAWNLAVCL